MNRQECDILNNLIDYPFVNQRLLAETSGHSLGSVNKSLKILLEAGYIDDTIKLTAKALKEFENKAPKRAIILAAGFGMRMVPINTETPKAFLEISGEPLIERIIKQLHDVGIYEIYVIVGFMKEKFEYLIDEYQVKLIVNPEYSKKNNLHSIKLALEHIDNTYIIPSDIWCNKNPFRKHELYSWYMVSDLVDNESTVRINRKMELVKTPGCLGGNEMIGISYILKEDANYLKNQVNKLSREVKYDDSFWEESLYEKNHMIIGARVVHSSDVVEINTYEQLREVDSNSNQLKSDAISIISKALNVPSQEIIDINVLKKGMTNRSFLFKCRGKKYIMRIPGAGTNKLINRREEASVYHAIGNYHLCDKIVYINPQTGYKITEFLENARVCNPRDQEDLKMCMDKLRNFHNLKLKVDHEFDIFKKIDFYESLWDGKESIYRDYQKTKDNVLSLKPYIEHYCEEKVLTHIDAVPDNFMIREDNEGKVDVRLIDWEYAAMQDPHVDIAMFCIYALYDRNQIDNLINLYFRNSCKEEIRIKIYCYIAVCGLLWSNWCEYKRNLGVEFGEYNLRQYRYAKDYYKIAIAEMKRAKVEVPSEK